MARRTGDGIPTSLSWTFNFYLNVGSIFSPSTIKINGKTRTVTSNVPLSGSGSVKYEGIYLDSSVCAETWRAGSYCTYTITIGNSEWVTLIPEGQGITAPVLQTSITGYSTTAGVKEIGSISGIAFNGVSAGREAEVISTAGQTVTISSDGYSITAAQAGSTAEIDLCGYNENYAAPCYVKIRPRAFLTDYNLPIGSETIDDSLEYECISIEEYNSDTNTYSNIKFQGDTEVLTVYPVGWKADKYSGYRFSSKNHGRETVIVYAYGDRGAVLANPRCYPLTRPLTDTVPWWGNEVITVDMDNTVNVWPSELSGTTGVTVSGNGPTSVIIAENKTDPKFIGEYATRYPYRELAILNLAYDYMYVDYNWLFAGPNKSDATDLQAWKDAVPVEDNWQWSEYSYLNLSIAAPKDATLTLKVYYKVYFWYIPQGYPMYGTATEYPIERILSYDFDVLTGANDIEINLNLSNEGIFPIGSYKMFHVDKIEIEFPDTIEEEVWDITDSAFNLKRGGGGEASTLEYRFAGNASNEGRIVFMANHDGKDVLEMAYMKGILQWSPWYQDTKEPKVHSMARYGFAGVKNDTDIFELVNELNSQLGWTATYSSPLESSQNKDGDGGYITENFNIWDLRWEYDDIGGRTLELSPMASSYRPAQGVETHIHMEAVYGGGIHGVAKNQAGTEIVRNTPNIISAYGWNASNQTWEYAGTVGTGAHGYFQIQALDASKPYRIYAGEISENQWFPSGNYSVGRIDSYEGVSCSGECDQFVQRFFEEKFGVDFLDNWWTGTLGWQNRNLPTLCTWIESDSAESMLPGDAPIFSTGGDVLHIGVVHEIDGENVYIANSNHLTDEFPNGDGLGYFDAENISSLNENLLGWIRYIGPATTVYTVNDREYTTYNPVIRIKVESDVNLHITYNYVTSNIVITDVGLLDNIGLTQVSNNDTWGDRNAISGTDETSMANTVAASFGTYLFEYSDMQTIRRLASTANDARSPVQINANGDFVMAVEFENKFYLITYNESKQYIWVFNNSEPYTVLAGPYEVAASDQLPAAIGISPTDYAFYAAVQSGGDTILYRSRTRGVSWEECQTITGMSNPAIYVTDKQIYVAGYIASATDGATGLLRVIKINAMTPTTTGESFDVGGSDEGRPAIFQHPFTWKLYALAPKTSTWNSETTNPGIVEYNSSDNGENWTMKEVHPVA